MLHTTGSKAKMIAKIFIDDSL